MALMWLPRLLYTLTWGPWSMLLTAKNVLKNAYIDMYLEEQGKSSGQEGVREEAAGEVNAFLDAAIADITMKSEYSWKLSRGGRKDHCFCLLLLNIGISWKTENKKKKLSRNKQGLTNVTYGNSWNYSRFLEAKVMIIGKKMPFLLSFCVCP